MKRLEVMIIENRSRIEKAIGDAYELGKADERAEVIEEFFNNIKSICNKNCNECIFCIDETCEIACIKEKLKEQNKCMP